MAVLRGRWLQKHPGAPAPPSAAAGSHPALFLAAMQRNSCSQSGDAVILWGKLQRAPLHPHALWVLKPVFQALSFFSEDTPVPPDAEWEGGT